MKKLIVLIILFVGCTGSIIHGKCYTDGRYVACKLGRNCNIACKAIRGMKGACGRVTSKDRFGYCLGAHACYCHD